MKLLGLKPPKPPKQPGMVTRDDARDAANRQDDLRRRQGSAGDVITGNAGVEGGPGGKVLLG